MGQIILRYRGKEEEYELKDEEIMKIKSIIRSKNILIKKFRKFKNTWNVKELREDEYYV